MKRNVFQDGNDSGLVTIEGLGEYVPVAQLAELEQCIADQKRLTKELDIAMALVIAVAGIAGYGIYQWVAGLPFAHNPSLRGRRKEVPAKRL